MPYVRQPEEIVPGRPLFFATAMPLGGVATGLLVESHEGRPTEDRRQPAASGQPRRDRRLRAGRRARPLRSRSIADAHAPRRDPAVAAFLGAIRARADGAAAAQGRRAPHPHRVGQLADARRADSRSAQRGSHRRNGINGIPRAATTRAPARSSPSASTSTRSTASIAPTSSSRSTPISSAAGPGGLRYARDFAARRRPEQADRMNRLYAIESMPTSTGSRADHRLPLRPSEIEGRRSRAIAARPGSAPRRPPPAAASTRPVRGRTAVAKDLQAHRGSSLVVAGDGQPPVVHALAHAMNQALGNAGKTVVYTDPVEAEPVDQLQSLRDLVADMNAGKVDVLVIVGGNPVYTAPADLKFADAMGKVPLRVHLSLYDDETSALCHWQIPEAHFLEVVERRARLRRHGVDRPAAHRAALRRQVGARAAGGDERPPRSGPATTSCASSGGRCPARGTTPEVESSRARAGASTFRRGAAGCTTASCPNAACVPPRDRCPVFGGGRSARRSRQRRRAAGPASKSSFATTPAVLDGRFANNGWLQELPKPITKLTWDNAVLVSPATAARLNGGGTPSIPGRRARADHQRRRRAALSRPHGPRRALRRRRPSRRLRHRPLSATAARAPAISAPGAGFNANAIRTSDAPWFGGGLEIVGDGETYSLACTQYHHLMEGRGMVRAVTRDEFIRDPKSVHEG